MLPSTCVVVPTYWTRAGGAIQSGDAIYDHPTPVDSEGTLDALLKSLAPLKHEFYLLILVAVSSEEVADAAEERVRGIVSRYSRLQALVFGTRHLRLMHHWMGARGLESARSFLALKNYPTVRNLQLAVPLTLGSTSIVALDDDEIVTDEAFLSKATEPLGTTVDGVTVDGLSGHYLQDNGSILLHVDPEKASSPNIFDRKAAVMNAATDMLEGRPGNLVETPFCFGGNMEFTDDLASSVGFDPGITRGEDIDYLINARIEGRAFFLRKDLRILHCPPKGGSYKDVSRSKLEQDVIRFLYEREKLRVSQDHPDLHAVTAEELMPYPGEFLDQGVERQAEAALEAAGYTGDASAYVREVETGMSVRIDRYLRFRQEWPRATSALRDGGDLRDALSREVNGG
jgi:hypothetical protein